MEDNIVTVQVNSEIKELEKGLSAVRYEGEDGFAAFLAVGGAKTDREDVQFLVSRLSMGEQGGLTMDTQAFGCSTLSVQNTEGGYLFGRNFDWNTCDALVVISYPQDGYASVSTVNLGFIRQGAGIAVGNSVAVEYIDNEMIVVETPVLTNFYLAEGEKQGIGTSQSHERFDRLTETLAEKPTMTQAEVRDALDSVSKDNFGEFERSPQNGLRSRGSSKTDSECPIETTEWSIVFDQSALSAAYYHRENYEKEYFFQIAEE